MTMNDDIVETMAKAMYAVRIGGDWERNANKKSWIAHTEKMIEALNKHGLVVRRKDDDDDDDVLELPPESDLLKRLGRGEE